MRTRGRTSRTDPVPEPTGTATAANEKLHQRCQESRFWEEDEHNDATTVYAVTRWEPHFPSPLGRGAGTAEQSKHHCCLRTVKTEWGVSKEPAVRGGISIHYGASHRHNNQHQGQTRSARTQCTHCLRWQSLNQARKSERTQRTVKCAARDCV